MRCGACGPRPEVLERFTYDSEVKTARARKKRRQRAFNLGLDEDENAPHTRWSLLGGYRIAAKRAIGYLGQNGMLRTLEVSSLRLPLQCCGVEP